MIFLKSLGKELQKEQFLSKKFGKGIAKRAVELKLLRQGFYTQPKRVMQAEKYIEQFFAAKKINLEELAELYGLKERTTKLFPDKKPLLVENTQ